MVHIYPFVKCVGRAVIDGIEFGNASGLLGPDYRKCLAPFWTDGGPIHDAMVCVESENRGQDVLAAETALFFALHEEVWTEHTTRYSVEAVIDNADTWRIHTRLGGVMGQAEHVRIAPPWPLTQTTLRLDRARDPAVLRLANCGGKTAGPMERRLFRAAQLLLRVRGLTANWEERVLICSAAAEALLDVPDKDNHRQFTSRFQALFDGVQEIYDWADDFYTMRSRIVHGALITADDRWYTSKTPFGTKNPQNSVTRKQRRQQLVNYHDTVALGVLAAGIVLKLNDDCENDPYGRALRHQILWQKGVQAVTSPAAIVRQIAKLKDTTIRKAETVRMLERAALSVSDIPPPWADGDTVHSWIDIMEQKRRLFESGPDSPYARMGSRYLLRISNTFRRWLVLLLTG